MDNSQEPVREVRLTRRLRSLSELSVNACLELLNFREVLRNVNLPSVVLNTVYEQIYRATDRGDVSSISTDFLQANQGRLLTLDLNDGAANSSADCSGYSRLQTLMVNAQDISGGFDILRRAACPDIRSMEVHETAHLMYSDWAVSECTKLEYFKTSGDISSFGRLGRLGRWSNLQTLVLERTIRGLTVTNLIIRTVCRIQSLRNLSIRFGYFEYPLAVLECILRKLPKLKCLDVAFSSLAGVSLARKDDLYNLKRKQVRLHREEHCIVGFATRHGPLDFMGTSGSHGICKCGAEWHIKRKIFFAWSRRGTFCRNPSDRVAASSQYADVDVVFAGCQQLFVNEILESSQHHRQAMLELALSSLEQSHITDYFSSPANFQLLTSLLQEFQLDRYHRNVVLAAALKIISSNTDSLVMGLVLNSFIQVMLYCIPDDLKEKQLNELPAEVAFILLKLARTCAQNSEDGLYQLGGYVLLTLLWNLTDESPGVSRNLLDVSNASLMMLFHMCEPNEEFRVKIYGAIGNICEVPELCPPFICEPGLVEQLILDCGVHASHTFRRRAIRLLACMSISTYWEENVWDGRHHHILSLIRKTVPTFSFRVSLHYNSLSFHAKLLRSKVQEAKLYALWELVSLTCHSSQDVIRRHAFMVLLEGLLPLILRISEDHQGIPLSRRWAAEVVEAVEAVTGF